jgi:hypothetical protein
MAERKRRIRKHVIADQSLYHLSYEVAKCGFTIEAIRADYGYDGIIVTYDPNGEVENGIIYIQLKATDKIVRSRDGSSVLFRVSKQDADLWGREPFPVYLVLFDTASETAYWLYFQKYLARKAIKAANIRTKTFVVYIDTANKVDTNAITTWRNDKTLALRQMMRIRHA